MSAEKEVFDAALTELTDAFNDLEDRLAKQEVVNNELEDEIASVKADLVAEEQRALAFEVERDDLEGQVCDLETRIEELEQ